MPSAVRRISALLVAILAATVALSGCLATTVLTASAIKMSDGRSYLLDGSLTKTEKHPLLIVLSGVNESAPQIAEQTGYGPFGKARGITVAYGVPAANGWNAGGCCGTTAQKKVDDMSYLLSIVRDVSGRLPIDMTRVYVVGFSTGGMMAERAACERPDVFAAAGSVAGALLVPCPNGARIVHVHGAKDFVVPMAGGYSLWVNFTFPNIAVEKGKILTDHPNAAYSLIVLPKAGHGWPTAAQDGFDATSQVWTRISGYTLPNASPTPSPNPSQTPEPSVTPTPTPTDSPTDSVPTNSPAPTDSPSPSDPASTDVPATTDTPTPTDVPTPTDSPTGLLPAA